jgi:hypothetical protein
MFSIKKGISDGKEDMSREVGGQGIEKNGRNS